MVKNQRAFTLVELMVVITIIGIMATFGFTNYTTSQKRARDGRRRADLEQIRSALEMCRADVGAYPDTIYSGVSCGGNSYLTSTPQDPATGADYAYTPAGSTYTLCASLETASDPDYPTFCVSNP